MVKVFRLNKPWGFFHQFTHNELSTVKILTVNAHQQLSLQSHRNREELWIFIDHGLTVEVDNKRIEAQPYQELYITAKTKHRLINNSDKLFA